MTAAANLKFTYEDIELIDTPDLIINLWTYNFLLIIYRVLPTAHTRATVKKN